MTIEVFGITGTNGKTTVSYMLKSILEEAGRECGLIGTITHVIGQKQYDALNTTPSGEVLEKYFHEMEQQHIGTCIMEVSSHGLDQGRVDNIDIHYSGFTNLTRDHLDYHVTMDNYFNAKAKLFYKTKKGMCINIDDVYGKRLYDKMKQEQSEGGLDPDVKVESISFMEKNADYFGKLLENSIHGIVLEPFEAGASWGTIKIELPGRTTAYNGLLALSMARQAGMDKEVIIEGLRKLKGVPGRFQKVENSRGIDAVIDFAHTPDALENLLKTAGELHEGRLICVFGCGGNRDREKRSMMGKIAGNNSDLCIITSDNPRFEEPALITEEIEKGIVETACEYVIEIDRREAIRKAVARYQQGDLIVIAGKGHEKYQLVNGKKLPFDDYMTVQEIINMRE
ncbi:UDP-N-acetylmuramoyl-L-alanyl-D-glutamate--2,6-diaminopimelate ligase [Aminipila luticellarii]|mgnify:CR=1 FL=1|uniref:UDP-N-acetylmuramoyl-L-alanyl-D-glutamate--2, 6-diaminopimelate ligase n=1 Tax=Aminipila luticellarii TaxID=2507160 RepID=A0A410PWJ5_9FIRM|nr:UDP-N-acetylmuramoyl-L-alanyl-D-glutamate--2,6-diaminopimelate ligase [Aminipila luticellarii]QAT43312.1 UDP-N-acetylmuramoyl-L-alanyl-D-glutamate--2,6-diaminopimelate ligase [Aminipila luticellarii]